MNLFSMCFRRCHRRRTFPCVDENSVRQIDLEEQVIELKRANEGLEQQLTKAIEEHEKELINLKAQHEVAHEGLEKYVKLDQEERRKKIEEQQKGIHCLEVTMLEQADAHIAALKVVHASHQEELNEVRAEQKDVCSGLKQQIL